MIPDLLQPVSMNLSCLVDGFISRWSVDSVGKDYLGSSGVHGSRLRSWHDSKLSSLLLFELNEPHKPKTQHSTLLSAFAPLRENGIVQVCLNRIIDACIDGTMAAIARSLALRSSIWEILLSSILSKIDRQSRIMMIRCWRES